MAIIYSYQENEELRNSDMLVGTATALHNGQVRKITKNFTLGQLKTFISTGGLILSNGGTSGPATLIDNVLNIPVYQGQITLTTTGSTGSATLIGNTLNIPVYSGGVIYTFNAPLTEASGTVSISQANTTTNGYLSSTDWNIFNGKQDTITLTTTGSGAATFISNVLNIPTPPAATFTSLTTTGSSGSSTLISGVLNVPTYTLAGLGGITLTSLSSTATGLTYTNTTGVFSLTAGYSIPTTSSQTNWDTAYTNRITSLTTTGTGAATLIANVLNIPTPPTTTFTSLTTTGSSGSSALTAGILNVPTYTLAGLGGVPTSRTLTINGTAYDLTADRSWSVGTVTSVGLSMPSAFTVSSSPVTGSGTIAVTGAGVSSQYVRGDGTLANFPTSTGGGASVSYYLNGSVSQGTIGGVAYKELNSVPVIGTGTDFTINADGYIAQFITDVGDPNKLLIPAGNWNFETYFSASSGGGSPRFYIELYKYNGTTFTLIASNSTSPEFITGGTSIDLYFSALAVPPTTLAITDRLAVRFYVIHSGRTITMHTENSHLSQVITTFSSGLTALNGLTSQVQYFAVGTSGTDFNISSATDTHTFNLPTASATNRGALSSADWTAFNGKFTLPSLTSGSVLFSNGTTLAQDNSNFFWDDTNNRLGIGTASPGVRFVNSGAISSSGPTLGSAVVGSQALLSNNGLYGMYSGVSDNGDVWHQVQANNGTAAAYNLVLQPSGGNIYLGTTSSIYATPSKFQILFNGAVEYGINFKTNAAAAIPLSFIASSGSQVGYIIYDNTGTAYTTISDYRLKEDLTTIGGLDLISKINVYDYKWKDQDKRSYGVLAHELQEIIPQAVFGEKDGIVMQTVDYSILVPILIQAIKELEAKITTNK